MVIVILEAPMNDGGQAQQLFLLGQRL